MKLSKKQNKGIVIIRKEIISLVLIIVALVLLLTVPTKNAVRTIIAVSGPSVSTVVKYNPVYGLVRPLMRMCISFLKRMPILWDMVLT